ncbi:dUTPase [Bacillus sp. THAF10]|uniref:dUTP diphosphatase n=1 Tax=Bacillus sp. THAF10 TaxID=2587848 RepID=UPI001267EEC9|nr:dUTP diphosphatase [Bacillus sp. THAF10]QFT90130.1 dUTPase [Bacillus sp. THAF10]
MDISLLMTFQKELDERIETKHGLVKEELVEKKILALLVELGELANETRCFKFWSEKPPAERKVILEEYVDGVHFILSLGITFQFQEELVTGIARQCDSLSDQFNLMYEQISSFRKEQTEENFVVLFDTYHTLGEMLGFHWEEIEQAYLEKNKVNHQRQQEGY